MISEGYLNLFVISFYGRFYQFKVYFEYDVEIF